MISEKTLIEYHIFDKAFILIERYVTNTQGLREAHRKEFNHAINNTERGFINWPKFMSEHFAISGGYVKAIETVSQLLCEAFINYERIKLNDSEIDNFLIVLEGINELVEIRENDIKYSYKSKVLYLFD
jgi:hypothetical protein